MLRLARPTISEEAIEEVAQVLRSGCLVQGEKVARFEGALAGYLGVKHAVAVSSGTAALHLALLALDIGRGDEVLVPAFTFPATANAVEICGARTVLVDVSLADYCIDTSILEASITPRTRAIIPVHEFGQAADMASVTAIAERNGLQIIEDAACALGTEYRGKKAGSLGLLGCFSFHPRKAITTGEGGAVTTNNDGLADRIRSLRNHGLDPNTTGGMEFVWAGLNYRMTEFQAALGWHQMQGIDDAIGKRDRQAEHYDELLADVDGLMTPARFADRRSVYQTYHVLLPETARRDDVIRRLKVRGIETNLGAHALNGLMYFQGKYETNDESCPAATVAWRRGLALPIGAHCQLEDQKVVAAELKRVLRS